jgi:hypothetical protein
MMLFPDYKYRGSKISPYLIIFVKIRNKNYIDSGVPAEVDEVD